MKSVKQESAVSPVVGVMLMLVVTIIIAAVVSAFAGGLAGTSKEAPVASFECHITNSGSWGGSAFDLAVLSTDKAIPTSDLKLVTSWTNASGYPVQTTITGPVATPNTYYKCPSGVTNPTLCTSNYTAPLGFGPGVNQSAKSGNYYPDQMWGNYSLQAGTHLHNSAYGWSSDYGGYGVAPDTRYTYTDGSEYVYADDMDGMQAILGKEWYQLKSGTVVNVQLIHTPSQKVIYDQDIAVESA
ncbi:MAG: type IV pilin N-terminal domain-containing protein [Methanoregula sp.]